MTQKEMEDMLKSLEQTLGSVVKGDKSWIGQWDKSTKNPPASTPWYPPKPQPPVPAAPAPWHGVPTIPDPADDDESQGFDDEDEVEIGLLVLNKKDKKLYIRISADDLVALDSVTDIKKLVTKLLLQDKLDA